MAKLEAEITVKGIREVKNICELLNKYYEYLPQELQNALIDIEKYGISDINVEYIDNIYPRKNRKIESSMIDYNSIISINKVLKKVVIFNGEKEVNQYPDHFWLKINDDMIVGW